MKRVAVLRGGPSSEYPVSMETGKAVLSALEQLNYATKDITITRQGEWLEAGKVRRPEQALEGVDVVFIALHGEYGEDGQVQRLLERLYIPFTGSRSMPSAIAFNKELTKQTLREHGVRFPRHAKVTRDTQESFLANLDNLFDEVGDNIFIKPVASGSSVGAAYAPTRERVLELVPTLLKDYEQLLLEEFILGKEATVGVLNDFRGEALYALPVIEVVPPRSDVFYSYENKYDGTTDHVCPGRFTYAEKRELEGLAKVAHKALGCDQYSRSDFIVRNGEVYFLETNTLPGFTGQSNFPIAAAAVGLEFPQLVQHLVETARV